MINAVGFCQEWNTDFDTAKQKAAATNKHILLVFSGPDWCENCTRLDELVWDSPEFKAEAEKSWVLLRADFKQKKGMQFITLFFIIPVIPISGTKHLVECPNCGAKFQME